MVGAQARRSIPARVRARLLDCRAVPPAALHDAALDEDDARRLDECIRDGGVAVLPTDTVYGIACDPHSQAAVQRLYELKGRPVDRPAAVMFFSLAGAVRSLAWIGERERAALAALLPGPVTLLLANPERRFPLACARDPGTLGVRVPRLPEPLLALARLKRPLLQSSANLSGARDARRLADVPSSMLAAVDLALDGGELAGVPSTVLDLRGYPRSGGLAIVREGALDRRLIERALADAGRGCA